MLYANIESENLFSYFKQSAIMPGRYFIRDFPSEQEIFRYHVLVSEHKWINYSDVSIELDIADYKLIPLERGLYLIDGIIPLSRVRNIWFRDISTMYKTVDFLKSKAVYISNYVHDEAVRAKIMCTEFIEERLSKNLTHTDLVRKTEMYRRYLGALALIRPFFPEDHDYIRKNLAKGGNHSLLKLLKGNSSLLKAILEGSITLKTVRAVAKKYGESVDVVSEDIHRTRGFILDQQISTDRLNKNGVPYIFAILYKYYSNLDGLLVEIAHLLPNNEERAKGILFCFGLMKAYNRLPNEFNIGHRKYPLKIIFDRNKETCQYDMDTLEYVHQSVFRDNMRIKKSDRMKIMAEKLDDSTFDDFYKQFKVSRQILKNDIKRVILDTYTDFKKRSFLYQKYGVRINKNYFYEQLEEIIKKEKTTLQKLAKELGLSEKNLKSKIRDVVDRMEYSYSFKTRILKRFGIRTSKKLRIVALKKLLQDAKLTTKELAKKLGVTAGTVRGYLKDVGASRERIGKRIEYSLD
jgi:transcriptional regulator with XRE-family HTH domain